MPRSRSARIVAVVATMLAIGPAGVLAPTTATSPAAAADVRRSAATTRAGLAPGEVVRWGRLPRRLWIPGTTRRAFKLTYVTTDTFGKPALSTGTVFIPRGRAPRGGWPVISWAHGTSGIGDACAPSRVGPALPERDFGYLRRWMQEGYAIVASDYAGLGTPGQHAYLDGKAAAHNIVDMVTAGRRFARHELPGAMRLSRKWVAVGQSQGGGASIYTARFATEYGGRKLSYRGAVGTGTPANIEKALLLMGPKVPPASVLPEGITAYVAYILASLRYARPQLDLDSALTDEGRYWVERAKTLCVFELEDALAGQNLGDWFTVPVATVPGFAETLDEYMGMPESGFDRPFFMGHGLVDTDVPYATTFPYAATLQANGEPVTFKSYPTDHSGTLTASLTDTVPFVADLFRH